VKLTRATAFTLGAVALALGFVFGLAWGAIHTSERRR